MRVLSTTYLLTLITLAIVSSCTIKVDPTPAKTSLTSYDAIMDGITISNGTKYTGSIPSASSSTVCPDISKGTSTGTVNSGSAYSLVIDYTTYGGRIASGTYFQISGSTKYFKIPGSGLSGSATRTVIVNFPSNLASGSITLKYAMYDDNGYVSNTVSETITVKN